MPLIFWVVGIVLVIVAYLWKYNERAYSNGVPPGPFLFPIVGVFPYFAFGAKFVDKLANWKKEYGSVFTIQLGSQRAVVLHDYDVIKEAFGMEEFTGRPDIAPVRLLAGDERRGIGAAEGPQWEAQRRFALRHLRDFGFGKKSLEGMCHEDILDLIERFRAVAGQPVSTASQFNLTVLRSLWHILAGERFDLEDARFKEIPKILKNITNTAASNAPAFTVDWLLKVAPDLTGWNDFKSGVYAAKDFLRNVIDRHKRTFQEDNFRDFIDVYVNEIRKTDDPSSTFFKNVGEENMLAAILNLFGAGTDTTSSTLSWSMYFLSRNPKVQKKFQNEIDKVVGRSRLVSLDDRNSMPYTNAVIAEVFRRSSLVPIGVPHVALSTAKFRGYTIPKGTLLLPNLYELHNNPSVWKNPDEFNPERFLTKDGTQIDRNVPSIAPFAIGKRQCLGETLARNNFFIFLVSLLQTFDVKEPIGEPKFVEDFGFFRLPPPFKVIFEERV